MTKLFDDEREAQMAVAVSAGIALHALLSRASAAGDEDRASVERAFEIARMFWALAEKEVVK